MGMHLLDRYRCIKPAGFQEYKNEIATRLDHFLEISLELNLAEIRAGIFKMEMKLGARLRYYLKIGKIQMKREQSSFYL